MIGGIQDYQSIHIIQTLLYDNVYTLTMNLGRDYDGHIEIIIWYTLYTKIFPTPYVVPVNPGDTEKKSAQVKIAQHL